MWYQVVRLLLHLRLVVEIEEEEEDVGSIGVSESPFMAAVVE